MSILSTLAARPNWNRIVCFDILAQLEWGVRDSADLVPVRCTDCNAAVSPCMIEVHELGQYDTGEPVHEFTLACETCGDARRIRVHHVNDATCDEDDNGPQWATVSDERIR